MIVLVFSCSVTPLSNEGRLYLYNRVERIYNSSSSISSIGLNIPNVYDPFASITFMIQRSNNKLSHQVNTIISAAA